MARETIRICVYRFCADLSVERTSCAARGLWRCIFDMYPPDTLNEELL